MQIQQNERRLTLSLLAFLCLLYLPFAGNYGLWDPWETHYGEVARQMVQRGDYISLWWPGSPNERETFWSKPVGSFWLMALSLKAFGLGRPGADPAEMASSWRPEWALRLPFVLCGILGVLAIAWLVRRLLGRGPSVWAAVILATSTQWALIARQAMTDMAFVAPMTAAMACAGLALLLPEAEVRAPLPRRRLRLLGRTLSWPHHRDFYLFLGLYAACVLPQLIIDSVQLRQFTFSFFGRAYRTFGFVAMLPWAGLFALSLAWLLAARDRRTIYLWGAYLCGALATLAKGPAGIALPALSLLAYLVLSGRLAEFLGPRRERPHPIGRLLPGPLRVLSEHQGGLEILRGTLIFLCVCGPWYWAMTVRHGIPFWNEFIGDNYVNRAQGRHGDRGTFEYYLRQLAAGTFPWCGLLAAALVSAGRWLRDRSPRRQLVLLCLTWLLADFMVVSLVATKFHHYILPALPALAILGALLIDELLQDVRDAALALLLFGLPITWLTGRDLAGFPARIGWLFNYDYVNVPVHGRPWPQPAVYGLRYEYGDQVFAFAVAATLLSALVWALMWRPRPADPEVPAASPPLPWAAGLLFLALLSAAIAVAPSPEEVARWSSSALPPETVLPARLRLGFLVPAAAGGLWLVLLLRRGAGVTSWPVRGVAALALLSVLWNTWVLDRFLIDLSPHWSQKSVFAAYYRMRKGPEEPVVVWYLFWRGEILYTSNQIYDHRLPVAEKTVFEREGDTEKLRAYLNGRRGRRVFFVCERGRVERLRGLLPQDAQPTLKVVDTSNNKLALAVAQL